MATEVTVCPECHSPRSDLSTVCPTCGAPPLRDGEHRTRDEDVRTQDLEPYVALRYIAKLFKVLAALMMIVLVGDIIAGLVTGGTASLPELIGEVTKMLVLAGFLWGGGDLTLLGIDAGHDLRVVRILLGRINAEMHRRGIDKPSS